MKVINPFFWNDEQHSMLIVLEGNEGRYHIKEGQNKFFKANSLDFQRLKGLINVAASLVKADSYFYVCPDQKTFVLVFSEKCCTAQINRLSKILESIHEDAIISIPSSSIELNDSQLPYASLYTLPVFEPSGRVHGIAGILSTEPVNKSIELSDHFRIISEQIMLSVQLFDQREQLNAAKRTMKLQGKKIREIENILHYTNENSPIGIIQCTVDGEITEANTFFLSLIESNPESVHKSYWFEYVTKEQRGEVISEWRNQAGQITMFTCQCSFVGTTEIIKTAKISGRPIVTIDGSVRYLLFVTDLTQQLLEEEQARQLRQRDLQMIRQKERFIANVSHEIRMPMSAIIGFADILMQQSVEPKHREFVEIIRNAGENLLTIINSILDFSKVEADLIRSGSRDFKVSDIKKDVYDLLQLKAEQKGLTFLYIVDENIPAQLTGDYTHLRQVLINLTGNAIKFTEKGYVALEISMIEADDFRCKLQFRIRDTGPGIPEESQQRIFERYFQVDSSSPDNIPGTGLGLSISKSLVEEMGGSIELKSQEGSGAEFVFSLYFSISEIKPSVVHEEEVPVFKNPGDIRLLIFEDNELNKHLIRHLMTEFGFSFDIAGNGVEGLTCLQQYTYDIIFMDLEMPVMDGYMATQEIRRRLGLSVPIIAMTAHIMSGEREKCLSLGMNDFVSKPISQSQMLNIIYRYTEANDTDRNLTIETETCLDLSYLQSLSSGNMEFERQMMELFIQTAPGKIHQLRQHILDRNVPMTKKQTHHIKGSMQIMGLTGVLRYIELIDHVIEQQDHQETALNYCDEMLHRTEEYIKLLRYKLIEMSDSLTNQELISNSRAEQFMDFTKKMGAETES